MDTVPARAYGYLTVDEGIICISLDCFLRPNNIDQGIA